MPTFENETIEEKETTAEGWFSYAINTIKICWTVIENDRPNRKRHYLVKLWEIDPIWDDELGMKIHCVEPREWTLRHDGRYQVRLCHDFEGISEYYGIDWKSTISEVPSSCSAITSSLEKLSEKEPIVQVISIQVGEYALRRFSYGDLSFDFSEKPLSPGTVRSVRFEPKVGTLPFAFEFEGHKPERGFLTGLVPGREWRPSAKEKARETQR